MTFLAVLLTAWGVVSAICVPILIAELVHAPRLERAAQRRAAHHLARIALDPRESFHGEFF